jgi:hypothetical protein
MGLSDGMYVIKAAACLGTPNKGVQAFLSELLTCHTFDGWET